MDISDEAAGEIWQWIETANELEKKSGEELAQLVENHLIGDTMSVLSAQAALLDEVCRRLRRYDKLMEAAAFVKSRLPKLHAQTSWLMDGFSALHFAMRYEPALSDDEEEE